jgi:hypothetical protein
MTPAPALGDKGILVRNERPRSDDAHLAGQHVQQLWQFVEVGSAQRAPDARQARMHGDLLERVRRDGRELGAGRHRSELEDAEGPTVATYPVLEEQHRATVVDEYRQGDDDEHGGQQQ